MARRRSLTICRSSKDILEETYGVILYQEQVMQIANRLCDLSLGEANLAPRDGQKRRDGGAAREVHGGMRDEQNSEKEGGWNLRLMEEFAGYGFNKSHSCAYALLAYQTAVTKPGIIRGIYRCWQKRATPIAVKYINEARGMATFVPAAGRE